MIKTSKEIDRLSQTNLKQIQKIIFELIQTEKSYVQVSMTFMVHLRIHILPNKYSLELLNTPKRFLSITEQSTLNPEVLFPKQNKSTLNPEVLFPKQNNCVLFWE